MMDCSCEADNFLTLMLSSQNMEILINHHLLIIYWSFSKLYWKINYFEDLAQFVVRNMDMDFFFQLKNGSVFTSKK